MSNADHAAKRKIERVEDLTWMARAGEGIEGASMRLGIKPSALEKWSRTNGLSDLYRQLVANDIGLGAGARRGRLGIR